MGVSWTVTIGVGVVVCRWINKYNCHMKLLG